MANNENQKQPESKIRPTPILAARLPRDISSGEPLGEAGSEQRGLMIVCLISQMIRKHAKSTAGKLRAATL